MQMTINFLGNKQVTSTYKGFTVETDQPQSDGGDGSAPEPQDLKSDQSFHLKPCICPRRASKNAVSASISSRLRIPNPAS